METNRLNLLDAAWLSVETRRAPMHVGGLLVFQIPDDVDADFCQRIVDHYRSHSRAYKPWNQRLRNNPMKRLAPEWELLDEIDTEYHFSHSALPAPGGERELGILASRIHSHPLDFRRPPWECHLIEGLENNRFAVYLKVHHSVIDGVAGMKLLARAMAETADEHGRPPFWAIEPKKHRKKAPEEQPHGIMRALADLSAGARHQAASIPALAGIMRDMIKSARTGRDSLTAPFTAPMSRLNHRVDSRRRYATQLFSLAEFTQLAENADVTINDIILTICGGALRRYLREIGELPNKPLTAGLPVAVPPTDADEVGNALSFIIATLATDIADPRARLETIAASTRRAKSNLKKLSGAAITQYTFALMGPLILSLLTGMGGRTRPVFNVIISNLPGPKQDLYLEGARMEAFYPTSLVTHGLALNITIHGYADTLGFGFIGCGETLPSLQRLAVYTGEEADELRKLYGEAGSATAQTAATPDASGTTGKTQARTRARARAGTRAKAPSSTAEQPARKTAARRRKSN